MLSRRSMLSCRSLLSCSLLSRSLLSCSLLSRSLLSCSLLSRRSLLSGRGTARPSVPCLGSDCCRSVPLCLGSDCSRSVPTAAPMCAQDEDMEAAQDIAAAQPAQPRNVMESSRGSGLGLGLASSGGLGRALSKGASRLGIDLGGGVGVGACRGLAHCDSSSFRLGDSAVDRSSCTSRTKPPGMMTSFVKARVKNGKVQPLPRCPSTPMAILPRRWAHFTACHPSVCKAERAAAKAALEDEEEHEHADEERRSLGDAQRRSLGAGPDASDDDDTSEWWFYRIKGEKTPSRPHFAQYHALHLAPRTECL